MASTPCPSQERWQKHLAGDLPAAEEAELIAHLGTCPACPQILEALAGSDDLLRVAREVGSAPAPAEPALQRAIEGLQGQPVAGSSSADAFLAGELPPGFLQPSDRPGSLGRLGHYEILEVVGRGGMGIVFRARDDRLHRVVAIKVLAPQLAASALARQRFTREAQAAAAVSHDHVVTIHAVEEAQGLPYLVMQYVSGVSLQERLKRSGALTVKEVLRIGMQTAAIQEFTGTPELLDDVTFVLAKVQ
jgi:hypothetical protein